MRQERIYSLSTRLAPTVDRDCHLSRDSGYALMYRYCLCLLSSGFGVVSRSSSRRASRLAIILMMLTLWRIKGRHGGKCELAYRCRRSTIVQHSQLAAHNALYVIQPECHEASNGITSSKRSSLSQLRYKCSVIGAKARALAG
jgi:hypothetical protein